jgi:hypothetical protein
MVYNHGLQLTVAFKIWAQLTKAPCSNPSQSTRWAVHSAPVRQRSCQCPRRELNLADFWWRHPIRPDDCVLNTYRIYEHDMNMFIQTKCPTSYGMSNEYPMNTVCYLQYLMKFVNILPNIQHSMENVVATSCLWRGSFREHRLPPWSSPTNLHQSIQPKPQIGNKQPGLCSNTF